MIDRRKPPSKAVLGNFFAKSGFFSKKRRFFASNGDLYMQDKKAIFLILIRIAAPKGALEVGSKRARTRGSSLMQKS